jgi:hypothetical protein
MTHYRFPVTHPEHDAPDGARIELAESDLPGLGSPGLYERHGDEWLRVTDGQR